MSVNDILIGAGQKVRSVQKHTENDKSEIIKPVTALTTTDRNLAVVAGLVPEAYGKSKFDSSLLANNIELMNNGATRKFQVTNLDGYVSFADGLIATIMSGKLPVRSYIIGAPNGFGKTSLANECITILFKLGRVCAPYISLTELAQLRQANDKDLLQGLSSAVVYHKTWSDTPSEKEYNSILRKGIEEPAYEKKPINIIGRFSYSEYLNCSVLFCYFSDARAKQIESEMLKTVLTIRASKGLPTIAMLSTSLNVYTRDPYLSQYVWDEILEYNEHGTSYDRVKHISCFKNYYVPLR